MKRLLDLILQGELEIEFQNEVSIDWSGVGAFIPDGAEYKRKARVITKSVKIVFLEDI